MICISVIPCLSIGLAKNNKIMHMFVLFSRHSGPFESMPFLKNGDKPHTKAVKQHVLSIFQKYNNLVTIF